ncbi:alpha/beta fold hydrolase [Patescibacteria group bacterium]|nr:alpha/beta fold hydrolase [Patescibacteria group bacterium]
MNKRLIIPITGLCIIGGVITYGFFSKNHFGKTLDLGSKIQNLDLQTAKPDPLSIEYLQKQQYPGSDIVIEQTLTPGSNYNRYIASYQSEGLKIYGLFTTPTSSPPENGYPAVILLHGYLPPKEYKTTERYVAYQDGFARNGYITFKPDLRGHGQSEGEPVNAHFSFDYVVDNLNLVSSLKDYQGTDVPKIGVWGHSNGGEIALRSMVISSNIKAGVIWAGVVGSFEDLVETYRAQIPWIRAGETNGLVQEYGSPSANPNFWRKIDPYYFLKDISGPIQLHHGTADESVPKELSLHLKEALEEERKIVEYFEYSGADHNLSDPSFSIAMERSVTFFDRYLKN